MMEIAFVVGFVVGACVGALGVLIVFVSLDDSSSMYDEWLSEVHEEEQKS